MKKMMFVFATLMFSLVACADNDQMINYSKLPVQAQVFIQKYFNAADVMYVERERDGIHAEYNVYLKRSIEIEFDHQGELKSIDCGMSPLPDGIVPEVIAHYVSYHFNNAVMVEYVKGRSRVSVELSNGTELIFDLSGNFIGVDD